MNRAVVSLVRDWGPAVPAQDKMGWPPFLIRNNPGYTPTAAKRLPRESFCWCSGPLPLPLSFISTPNSTCSFSTTGCKGPSAFGGEVMRRVFSAGFTWPLLLLCRQHGAQIKGLGGALQKHERRERRTFLSFVSLRGLTPVRKYVHLLLRKEGRKGGNAKPPTELLLLCSDFCPLCVFVNLPCPGRLFFFVMKCSL